MGNDCIGVVKKGWSDKTAYKLKLEETCRNLKPSVDCLVKACKRIMAMRN